MGTPLEWIICRIHFLGNAVVNAAGPAGVEGAGSGGTEHVSDGTSSGVDGAAMHECVVVGLVTLMVETL